MGQRMQRAALLAGMAVATLNVWTGAPLLGLWVGSRLVGDAQISMPAVAAVALTILATCLVLVRLLGVLSARYDRLSGRRATTRQHVPWLRSMRGERPHELGTETGTLSALDYVLVAGVIVACAAFEVWFFFFSGSSLDQRTGRG
jgi:hypothetical protein